MIAQLLVLILFRFQEKFIRGQDIFISTHLDNQAAEAILQQGFTQLPIPAAITKAHQILTFQSRTFLQPFRASSAENVRADDLSRGRILQEDPQGQLLVDITVLMEAIFSDGASHLARLRGVKRWVMQAKGVESITQFWYGTNRGQDFWRQPIRTSKKGLSVFACRVEQVDLQIDVNTILGTNNMH